MGLLARFSHKQKTANSPSPTPGETRTAGYRGVRIRANGDHCCHVVRTLADERFLLDEAPMLPLSLCDAEVCQCSYERFDDRRAGARRASDIAFDIASNLHDEESRDVKMPGRRSKDLPDF